MFLRSFILSFTLFLSFYSFAGIGPVDESTNPTGGFGQSSTNSSSNPTGGFGSTDGGGDMPLSTPPPPPPDPVPLDGGATALIIAAVGLGIRKLYGEVKNK
jgi:hypothetical protein